MSHNRHIRLRGFTLIELLIVIVIIGLLTGLATTSYINAQKSSRDTVRKSNVASISTAVEAFYQVKHRFPGVEGNEGGGNVPDPNGRTTWQGCLALDTTNQSVVYYSYPTLPAAQGGSADRLACNERSASAAGFDPSQFSPYGTWIPGLGEYLNPSPQDTRYQDAGGYTTNTLDASGTFDAYTNDVLGVNVAQALVYRHLAGGYMVYTRLEANTTDLPVGVAMTDQPKYPNGNGVEVYANNVFMIRK